MPSLPRTPADWSQYYRHGSSIHDFDAVLSASKITEDQFFAMKVIWPTRNPSDLLGHWSACFGSSRQEIQELAKFMVNNDAEWRTYLDALDENVQQRGLWKPSRRIPREMGTYSTAFHNQLEVNHLPQNAPTSNNVIVTPPVTRSRLARPTDSPSLGPGGAKHRGAD